MGSIIIQKALIIFLISRHGGRLNYSWPALLCRAFDLSLLQTYDSARLCNVLTIHVGKSGPLVIPVTTEILKSMDS